jgi:SH3-like domain-containing protein
MLARCTRPQPVMPMLRRSISLAAALLLGVSVLRAQEMTTTRDVNLRKGPSSTAAVITVLPESTQVTFLKTESHWDRVRTSDGTTGWIYERFLHDDTATTLAGGTLPPAAVPPAGLHVEPGTYHSCQVDGDVSNNAPHPEDLRALNLLKNRATAPSNAQLDPTFTLANLLKPGADDDRFDTANGGVIEGIVVDVKKGGIETVNCKATDEKFRDTHIEVARTLGADKTRRVIVEVTPRWRAAMKDKGVDWTTQELKGLCGHRVRFTGWAFFDTEHRPQAKNTAPGNPSDWRATVWELHPVTSIAILDNHSATCITQ